MFAGAKAHDHFCWGYGTTEVVPCYRAGAFPVFDLQRYGRFGLQILLEMH
jgi:hypothetical protein